MKNTIAKQLISLNLALFFLLLPILFFKYIFFQYLGVFGTALITYLALIPHFFGESCFTIYAGWLFSMIVMTSLYYWIYIRGKLRWKYFFFMLSMIVYSGVVLIFNLIML